VAAHGFTYSRPSEVLNSRETGFDSFFCTPGKEGAHERGAWEARSASSTDVTWSRSLPPRGWLAALNQLIAAGDLVDNGRVTSPPSRRCTHCAPWAGTAVLNGLSLRDSGRGRPIRPVKAAWVKPVSMCKAYLSRGPARTPASSKPMVSARRPWPGVHPQMMTSWCRMFLIQSRGWPGWQAEASGLANTSSRALASLAVRTSLYRASSCGSPELRIAASRREPRNRKSRHSGTGDTKS
jgi:hypothetical protein